MKLNKIDYRQLGDEMDTKGLYKQAAKYYQKAIQAGDNNPYLYAYIGLEQADPDKELFYYEQAIDLGIEEAWIFSRVGARKYELKEYKEAKRYLEKAIALGTSDPDSKNIIIKCNYWLMKT